MSNLFVLYCQIIYERKRYPLSINRKPNQNKTVQIELSDLKMQALEMSLVAKGKQFPNEINTYALHLYEKNVPKETKNFLASVEKESGKPTGPPTKED